MKNSIAFVIFACSLLGFQMNANAFDQGPLCAKTASQFSKTMSADEKMLVFHLCMDLGKSEDQIQACSDANNNVIGLINVDKIDIFEQCLSKINAMSQETK